jgi:peptidoglycan/LPS O-acetylase OafA/YrhL
MKHATSLYLDAVRFCASVIVFLAHVAIFRGSFWQFGSFAFVAVMIFFVLSGYVIAHVIKVREHTLEDYVSSRFGRLYSVVLPAIIISALCAFIISFSANNPNYNQSDNYHAPTINAFRYLATFTFTNRFWIFTNLEIENNTPSIWLGNRP